MPMCGSAGFAPQSGAYDSDVVVSGAGEARDLHFKGPPLLFWQDRRVAPFRSRFNVATYGPYPPSRTDRGRQ